MNQEDEVLGIVDNKITETINDASPKYRKFVLKALRNLRSKLMDIFGHGE